MTPAQAAGPPFRAEVIGSLLRPRRLKDAAKDLQQGRIDQASFDAVLEAEIARVIARQEDIGLGVVTDGELARSSWFGFFFEGLDGFRLEPSHFKFKDADGCAFEWATCVAKARIRRHAPIVLPEFERANPHVRRAVVKATMPAPSAFHFFRLGRSVETSAYADTAPTSTILSRSTSPSSPSWRRPAAATCSSTRCRSPCCAIPTCAGKQPPRAQIPRRSSTPISMHSAASQPAARPA